MTELVDPSINPNILAQLDPNLLPSPNTKVTTTIKTYTYEIPGSGYPSTVSPKLSETVYSSNPSTPSKSFAYNKIENVSTQNVSSSYPRDYVRPASPDPVGFKKNYIETTTTTRNISNDGYGKTTPVPVRSGKETYHYTETKNVNNMTDYPTGYSSPVTGYPSPTTGRNINVYKETTTTKNLNHPNGYPNNNYPTGVNKTYIHETHTTRNVTNSPYPNGYPNNNLTESFDPRTGPKDMNITYKYTTHHTTTNNFKGHPHDEHDPLLPTPPFPTDGSEIDSKGPPKRLDELMAEFGNEVSELNFISLVKCN